MPRRSREEARKGNGSPLRLRSSPVLPGIQGVGVGRPPPPCPVTGGRRPQRTTVGRPIPPETPLELSTLQVSLRPRDLSGGTYCGPAPQPGWVFPSSTFVPGPHPTPVSEPTRLLVSP